MWIREEKSCKQQVKREEPQSAIEKAWISNLKRFALKLKTDANWAWWWIIYAIDFKEESFIKSSTAAADARGSGKLMKTFLFLSFKFESVKILSKRNKKQDYE